MPRLFEVAGISLYPGENLLRVHVAGLEPDRHTELGLGLGVPVDAG